MASAIAAARQQINAVGADGDLDGATPPGEIDLDVDSVADPIELPDGKVIYPPKLHGQPIDTIACALLDMQQPIRSRFLRLIGPPGTGKSQIARAIAHRLWTRRGRAIETRHGEPFYGYAEMSGGPSSDEFTFRYEYVPDKDRPGDVRLIPAAFVEAMEHGWVVMIDEVNTIRDVALLSLNGTLDGRLSLYLPAEGRTVAATPGPDRLQPRARRRQRHPRRLALAIPRHRRGHEQLAGAGQARRPGRAREGRDGARRQALRPGDGLVWTPQFRDIEALSHMIELVGERAAVSLFISNLHEQIEAGKVQAAEGAAVARMLDEAGLGRLKVGGAIPNLHGYPRAVTR